MAGSPVTDFSGALSKHPHTDTRDTQCSLTPHTKQKRHHSSKPKVLMSGTCPWFRLLTPGTPKQPNNALYSKVCKQGHTVTFSTLVNLSLATNVLATSRFFRTYPDVSEFSLSLEILSTTTFGKLLVKRSGLRMFVHPGGDS